MRRIHRGSFKGGALAEGPVKVYRFRRRGRVVGRYGSAGATVQHLAHAIARGQVVSIELEPNGVLGRHEASADQLFIVVAGGGWVSGADGEEVPVSPGAAAFWVRGEQHQTRAGGQGLRAIVLEGEFAIPDELPE